LLNGINERRNQLTDKMFIKKEIDK